MNSFSHDEHERIINYLRGFPFIWDLSHSDYQDNEKRDDVFDNLGRELGRNGDDVAKCWVALRRKYRAIKESEKTPKSGAPGGIPVRKYKKSEWHLSPLLSFLDRTFKMRNFTETPLQPEPNDVPNIATQLENILPPPADVRDSVQFSDPNEVIDITSRLLDDDLNYNQDDVNQNPAASYGIGSENAGILSVASSSQDQTYIRTSQPSGSTQTIQGSNTSRQVRLPNTFRPISRPETSRSTSTTATRPILPRPQEQDCFPASKKKRVDQYAQERREIINSMKESIASAATSSFRSTEQLDSRSLEPIIERTIQQSQAKHGTEEQRMAHSYGDYVAMRFGNWSKEKQIRAFRIVNEAIEKAENINMDS